MTRRINWIIAFFILGVMLFHQGCDRKIRMVTDLSKGVWFVSDEKQLALIFIEDGAVVKGNYILTGTALSGLHSFEAKPGRKELVFTFSDHPEIELRGSLTKSDQGYLLISPGGGRTFFRAMPAVSIPRISERYRKPVFQRAIRSERTYGYAPGYYASKSMTDLSPSAYPNIILTVLSDVTLNMFSDSIRLDMDIFTPADDSMEKRPLILMMHGGAFVVGDKRDELSSRLSTYYAQCGYVVASINYRLGYPFIPGMYSQLERAIYRGIQDARAALRYLSDNSEIFKIDPGQVFLIGNSAGGFYSLFTAFMEDHEKWGSSRSSLFGLRKELGCLDCSTNRNRGKFTINGVVSLWGGLTDLNIITKDEKIPVHMIHGTADRIVPYGYDYPFSKIDKRLTAFFTTKVYGSKPIYDHMKLLGLEVSLNTIEGGHHEPQADDPAVFDMIRNDITGFFYSKLAGDPLRIAGPAEVDRTMKVSRYAAINHMGEEVRWSVKGGVVTRRGKQWIEVVWLNNNADHSVSAAIINNKGLGKTNILQVAVR